MATSMATSSRSVAPSWLYNNHGDYVKQVVRETNDLVKNRMWLQADGVSVKKDAAQAGVP
jgi:hypothetical protein